ncbi:MAG: hypothetical protein LBU95_01660 [Rikenellaceae bacterium]|jgi:hypothetical protein|nr:hypothetical protein [Rikenellaceae bacterium]
MKKHGPDVKRLAKNKHIKALYLTMIGILPMWFLVRMCVIAADGLTDRGDKGDFAVVLGNRINPDGSLSHRRFEARLECAITLYQNGRATTCARAASRIM